MTRLAARDSTTKVLDCSLAVAAAAAAAVHTHSVALAAPRMAVSEVVDPAQMTPLMVMRQEERIPQQLVPAHSDWKEGHWTEARYTETGREESLAVALRQSSERAEVVHMRWPPSKEAEVILAERSCRLRQHH